MRQVLYLDLQLKNVALSVDLKLGTARETYATSLKRAGVPESKIAEMMNHASTSTLHHYLASMNMEETQKVNSVLIKKDRSISNQKNKKILCEEWKIYLN